MRKAHAFFILRTFLVFVLINLSLFALSFSSKPVIKNPVVSEKDPGFLNKPTKARKPNSGPGQPEVQSFRPAGVTEMVDPFTGDFSYNLSLMDVGGYPINIFYNSGMSMEDEASWVGLGWNLSPGAVNRNVRGLPDDFNGENLIKEISVKDNLTVGTSGGINSEVFGLPITVGANAGISYNSYNGLGLDLGLSVSGSFALDNVPVGMGGGLNLQLSSGNGFTLGGGANLNYQVQNISDGSNTGTYRTHAINAGFSNNSRAGLSAQFNHSFSTGMLYKIHGKAFQGSSTNSNYPLAFAKEVFTPKIDIPMNGLSLSGRLQAGFEVQGVTVSADAKVYFSWQGLKTKRFTNPAYGYLYTQNGDSLKNAVLDFNREHDKPFEIENPQLPTANFSYDVYSVSGQGISGMFRPFRTDIGTLANNEITTLSGSGDLGGDVAAGTLAKVGVELGLNISTSYSGRWQSENEMKNAYNFQKTEQGDAETFYFKDVGEKNVMTNKEAFDALNGFNPLPLNLEGQGLLPAKLKAPAQSGVSIARTKREYRNTNFSILTIEEKKNAGLDKRIYLFNPNEPFDLNRSNQTVIDWTDNLYKPSHIGEINVTRDDGTRYFYGLPVYNIIKKEVSFNTATSVDVNEADNTDMAGYEPDDNSINNEKGSNNYYSAVETPPYAYAYLLTAILSTDYVDLSGDGPSTDDLGSYTRFNYIKGNERNKWRNPVQEDSSYFEKGTIADPEDDMANYTYGEKQVFHLHSVETRNYVAEFKVSARNDMHGVKDENGGLNIDDKAMKLDSIILYSKSDRVKNGTRAIPIKTVRFIYSYNLCRKHPGSESGMGKLTLERIVMSYKKSKKEMLSPYVFKYANNPEYAYRNTDRWGQFKKNGSTFPLQKKFSFTPQSGRKINADSSASAWALSQVELPTGGTIKIIYEADDYGYVQNRRAMQMFKIAGLGNSKTSSPGNTVFSSEANKNLFVFFNLAQPLNPLNDDKTLKEYLEGINELFFQVNTNVRYSGQNRRENIKGFARLKTGLVFDTDYGFAPPGSDGKSTRAWIKLEDEPGLEPNFSFHPFAIATFDFIRRNYPAADNVPLDKDSPIDQVITAFAGLAGSISEAIAGGFNRRMITENIGKNITLEESFIRLNNPDKKKIGGGSRVKRIEIHDNWKKMTQGADSNYYYGSEYEYTTIEDFNGSPRSISSGVASYEPMLGAEENPFVQPHRYSIRFPIFGMPTFPVENKMDMLPYGESFYPAPAVGYSVVKIRNLRRPGVRSTATGFNKKEYYTARDFPTIYRENGGPPVRVKVPPIPFPLLQVDIDFLTIAQSHVVELNDMHGKLKADWTYKESDSLYPISGIEYKYKRVSENGSLDNTFKVVDKNGVVKDALAGVEYDIVADERENSSGSLGLNLQGNIDVIQTIVPTPIPMIWPAFAASKKIFRSFSTTKIIMRSGILEKVIAHDLGASTATKNELFDEVTGMVVLTSANNEYGDTIYTLGIPAFWKYDGMGPAFLNAGFEVKNKPIIAGRVGLTANENKFVKGDEVLISQNDNTASIGWVLTSDQAGIALIGETGELINTNGNVSLKIIRSGRRNMQNISIGKIITKENPVTSGLLDGTKQVLHAEVNEFSEKWNTYAGFNVETLQYDCNCEKATGCRYSMVGALIQRVIDSLLYSSSFPLHSSTNTDFYRSLSDCWGKDLIGDSTVIGYEVLNNRMIISVIDKNKTVCQLEFPDPFFMVSKEGNAFNVIPVKRSGKKAAVNTKEKINIKARKIFLFPILSKNGKD